MSMLISVEMQGKFILAKLLSALLIADNT